MAATTDLAKKTARFNMAAYLSFVLGAVDAALFAWLWTSMNRLIQAMKVQFGLSLSEFLALILFSVIVIGVGLRGIRIAKGYIDDKQRRVAGRGGVWWGRIAILIASVAFLLTIMLMFAATLTQIPHP